MNKDIFLKRGHLFTDSQIIAKAVGRKHREVLKVIHSVFDDYENFRGCSTPPKNINIEPVFIAEIRQYRGEKFTAYLLNESAFNLILPRFKTRKALDAFLSLIMSFQKIKMAMIQAEANKDNLLWKEIRVRGKHARHNLADAITAFSDYSKKQGSKGYMYLYVNITGAIYKHVGIDKIDGINARDSLPRIVLGHLEMVEGAVCELLYVGMETNSSYKNIKADIKGLLSSSIEPNNGGKV